MPLWFEILEELNPPAWRVLKQSVVAVIAAGLMLHQGWATVLLMDAARWGSQQYQREMLHLLQPLLRSAHHLANPPHGHR